MNRDSLSIDLDPTATWTQEQWRDALIAVHVDDVGAATKIANLSALVDSLQRHVAAAPFCDEHKPMGGSRGGCLACRLREDAAALSRISYIAGSPNDMGVSAYDLHCLPGAVVEEVRRRVDSLQAEVTTIAEQYQEVGHLWRLAEDRADSLQARLDAQPTIDEVRGWLASRPGSSWQATINDLDVSRAALRATAEESEEGTNG